MDAGRRKNHPVFILNFHGIGEPKRKLSPSEQDYWIDSRVFADILDAVSGRENIHVTLDDSNESDYVIALPFLKARKMKANFFIVAGWVGQCGFLSRKQVQSLQAEGMTVGSHGMHHRRWPDLSGHELHQELVEARDQLEQITGAPIHKAACPYGDYNRRVLQYLHREVYREVYTSDGGLAAPESWIQPRNTIVRGDNLQTVRNIISAVPSAPKAGWRRFKLALKRWR